MADFGHGTKNEIICRHCGEALVLLSDQDVLDAVEVDLVCTRCTQTTTARLNLDQVFGSIYPQLLSIAEESDASNDNGVWSRPPPGERSRPWPNGEWIH